MVSVGLKANIVTRFHCHFSLFPFRQPHISFSSTACPQRFWDQLSLLPKIYPVLSHEEKFKLIITLHLLWRPSTSGAITSCVLCLINRSNTSCSWYDIITWCTTQPILVKPTYICEYSCNLLCDTVLAGQTSTVVSEETINSIFRVNTRHHTP